MAWNGWCHFLAASGRRRFDRIKKSAAFEAANLSDRYSQIEWWLCGPIFISQSMSISAYFIRSLQHTRRRVLYGGANKTISIRLHSALQRESHHKHERLDRLRYDLRPAIRSPARYGQIILITVILADNTINSSTAKMNVRVRAKHGTWWNARSKQNHSVWWMVMFCGSADGVLDAYCDNDSVANSLISVSFIKWFVCLTQDTSKAMAAAEQQMCIGKSRCCVSNVSFGRQRNSHRSPVPRAFMGKRNFNATFHPTKIRKQKKTDEKSPKQSRTKWKTAKANKDIDIKLKSDISSLSISSEHKSTAAKLHRTE